MKTLSLLCLPALALASTFTGTVVDLSGTPIVGAVVKTSVDSATTAGGGAWTLARTLSVARRTAKPISVASHLAVENRRPRLVFGGVDASGHRSSSVQTAPSELAAGRTASAVGTDTLKLFWKGKRLVVLPIAALDSTGIVLRVDTAWSDDASIPWNPAISYGSVLDARDGRTYRTVVIGSQRWMAENLNHRKSPGSTDTVGMCYASSVDSCTKYGRLYTWAEVMNGSASSSANPSGIQGLCSNGWHVPSMFEWRAIQAEVDYFNTTDGTKLKSATSWLPRGDTVGNGIDSHGFRALPGGIRHDRGSGNVGIVGIWWSATAYDTTTAYEWRMLSSAGRVSEANFPQTMGVSLRCIQD